MDEVKQRNTDWAGSLLLERKLITGRMLRKRPRSRAPTHLPKQHDSFPYLLGILADGREAVLIAVVGLVEPAPSAPLDQGIHCVMQFRLVLRRDVIVQALPSDADALSTLGR